MADRSSDSNAPLAGAGMPEERLVFNEEEQEQMEAALRARAGLGACPAPELLFAAQEDVLPAAEGVAVREHAAQCSLCQTLLGELDPGEKELTPGADARIRAEVRAKMEARSGRRARRDVFGRSAANKAIDWTALAMAAAIFVAAVLGVFGYRSVHPGRTRGGLVAANHPPAQMPAPPRADYPELHQLAPLPAPEDVPALVTRGASNAHGPTVEDLMPAFRAYNRGDFAQAAAAFAPMVKRFPVSDIPPLYRGVSQLHVGDAAAARQSLEQADALAGAHHAEAAWYLAVADLRLNEPKAAAALLRELCTEHTSEHAGRACVLEKQLGPA